MSMLAKTESERPTAAEVEAELTQLASGQREPHDVAATTTQSARRRRSHSLPPQRTALLGRAGELARIEELIVGGGVRLLTLTGPGGTGKTRLAIQAAENLAPRFEGGLAFVNLAPLADAALVASAVARSLDVRESGDLPLESAIAEHLRGRGADAAVPRQLRAGVGCGDAHPAPAGRLPGVDGSRDQPPGPAHLRRAGVPDPAAPAPGTWRAVLAIDPDGLPVGRAVRPARSGRQTRLHADVEERRRGGRDLLPARWPAARDRAGGRAGEDPASRRAARQDRTAARAPDRRGAGPAGAPADPSAGDQVELRPALAGRAEALPPAVGVRRRLHARSRGGCLQHARRPWCRRAGRRHLARGQQPARAAGLGGPRAALRDARNVPRVRP